MGCNLDKGDDGMNAIWLTDIHLNFLKYKHEELEKFYENVCNKIDENNADYVFITGDIGECNDFQTILSNLNARLPSGCKILFVLGNHDYYGGNVEKAREQAKGMEDMTYLTLADPIIHNDVMICGVDGFADGRNGNAYRSTIMMNDHVLIRDFKLATMTGKKMGLIKKMEELADADALMLDQKLSQDTTASSVVVLTHIPPFPEVSKYQGSISGEEFLPYYTSKATGDILLKHAKIHPNRQYLVLCGHSHHEAHFQPVSNMDVYCGKATYGFPEVQERVIKL